MIGPLNFNFLNLNFFMVWYQSPELGHSLLIGCLNGNVKEAILDFNSRATTPGILEEYVFSC